MKKFLLFAFIMVSQLMLSQGAPTCNEAYSLCNSLGVAFPNTVDTPQTGTMACLASTPNQSWFNFPIASSGVLNFSISQTASLTGELIDVDFACYGPFSPEDTPDGCTAISSGLTPIDCSYSVSATETVEIPNAEAGKYYLLLVTNFSNQHGVITINPLPSSTAVIGCSGIHVVSFIDTNLNGTYDADETAFPNGQFVYTNNVTNTQHEVTDANGDFVIYDENTVAAYNVSYVIPAPYDTYYSVSPAAGYSNLYPQSGLLTETFYFPVTIINPYTDVSIQTISRRAPQPGFTNITDIVYKNLGTLPSSGTITYVIGPEQTFEGLPAGAVATGTTGFEYNYTNLQPFETRTITVTTLTASDTAPQSVTSSVASIIPNEEETITENNTSSLSQVVVASYDPNDIVETHGPQINVATFNDAEDYLYYTIRFQNMGTADAHFINIEHTLDSQIDPSTVVMLHGSHDYEMDRIGTQLKWHLADIQLPPASINAEASNGYVYFKAKAYPGVVAGDIIPAAAAIYFDYNSAVITNTFETNFIEEVFATETVNKKAFSLYPNPANGLANITATDGLTGVTIYDITGKTLMQNTFNNETHITLSTDNLATGTYFVQVKTQSGFSTQKLIKQ